MCLSCVQLQGGMVNNNDRRCIAIPFSSEFSLMHTNTI